MSEEQEIKAIFKAMDEAVLEPEVPFADAVHGVTREAFKGLVDQIFKPSPTWERLRK